MRRAWRRTSLAVGRLLISSEDVVRLENLERPGRWEYHWVSGGFYRFFWRPVRRAVLVPRASVHARSEVETNDVVRR